MIHYHAGWLGVDADLICRLSGSVVLRALIWACPNACIGVGLWYLWNWMYPEGMDSRIGSVAQVISGFTGVLGFMVIFRVILAYQRFWKAAIQTHELRCTWFSAVSSLLAFTTEAKDKQKEVQELMHLMVRLFSMMHEAACGRLDRAANSEYVIMDSDGFDKESLKFLETCSDKCEVVEQWIQRLIFWNMKKGVITIPPPILSGVYNDLGKGILLLSDLEVVSDFPLPFPFAQMTAWLLLFHFCLTPTVGSLILTNARWSGLMGFCATFCLWAVNYIAQELELPFKDSKNSLPCPVMQDEMNRALAQLLEERMQTPPKFRLSGLQVDYIIHKNELNEKELKVQKTESMSAGSLKKGGGGAAAPEASA